MTTRATTRTLHRRLLPLQIGVALQGFMLWLPVEKLFMSEIGFDAASIGLMAAAYAVIVPFLEVPSGILADRWSRRGVLVVSSVALAACELIGGLSHNVATYSVSALLPRSARFFSNSSRTRANRGSQLPPTMCRLLGVEPATAGR